MESTRRTLTNSGLGKSFINRIKEDSMFKKLLLGIIAVGAVAMLWTEANAQVCVAWRRVGGSNVCTKTSTKGVLLELVYKQDCGSEGENCSADVFIEAPRNIAFCQIPSGSIQRITCNEVVTFSGPADQCEPGDKEDVEDNPDPTRKCTSTTVFTPPAGSCQASCAAAFTGSVVVDVTPIELDMEIVAIVGDGDYYGEGPFKECPPTSPACGFEQHCTIDPKKIQLNGIRPYECKLTSIFVPGS
jgi:hypothetical protein